jgi:hypothetical protein
MQFEGFGQRCGTNEIELAGAVGPLNDLDFGEVCHMKHCNTSDTASQQLSSIVSHVLRSERQGAYSFCHPRTGGAGMLSNMKNPEPAKLAEEGSGTTGRP